ncbi:hypothetical protein AMK19_32870 [Kitasatospora sp. CB01950]|nr:hypothetical protein AMK19_32870 [Kitasatospora sp. CB01950]
MLLVDFDDTLIDRLAAVTAWVAAYRADHGLGAAAEHRMLEAMSVRADLATFAQLRTELGLIESAYELWTRYSAELAAAVRPFPGALEALDTVRTAGWPVVIVTNGGAEVQRSKMRATGVAERVDAVCISEEVGARKPDRLIFETAAASVGRSLAQGGWMVGDNAELDVIGGREAGLRTVWISHGRPWPGGAEPDYIARDVLHALDYVRGGAR